MDTREAVARAICTVCGEQPDARWQDYVYMADAAIIEMAGGGVLVRLDRPDGYEDVDPQLVAEDAISSIWQSYTIL